DGQWQYSHHVELPGAVGRNQYLTELVSGRRVIHVGCATQGETREQHERGKLLFSLIEQSASAQLGVDPDSAGMGLLGEIVSPRWPLQICTLDRVAPAILDEFQPEMILFPEVLEHVPDAGSLLIEGREIAQRYGAQLVATVPNALSMSSITAWL